MRSLYRGEEKRREPRERIVRMVEYSAYPRVSRSQRSRVAFTRDESSGGMCLAVDGSEEIGDVQKEVDDLAAAGFAGHQPTIRGARRPVTSPS